MAVQFPDPNVTTTYTNPETGEVYKWNPTSGGWRREQQASGGSLPDPTDPDKQPGTLDDRYVNLNGDTMTGALVQHPDANTAPSGTGNLATNTPSDTRLEFRYQGSDDKVRCVTLPLGCCQTVTNQTHIEVQGGGSGFAEVGDVLEITQNCVIDPAAQIDETQWEIETAVDSLQFEDIPGATGSTYTVDIGDLGKQIRVRQVFLQGQECEKTVYSNVIAVSTEPPTGLFVGVTFSSGVLRMEMTLTESAQVYREVDGTWVQQTPLSAGVGVQFQTSTPGFYIVESEDMTALRFSHSVGDNGAKSQRLTLDERSYMDSITDASYMFYLHSDFNQDLSWWDTSNVTNMSHMFDKALSFDEDISNWNTSNVTNMSGMFHHAGRFNSDISSWTTTNVADMSDMFFCSAIFNSDISGWDTSNVTTIKAMFQNAQAFNQDIGSWDVSKVTNMRGTFYFARAFNADISGWTTTNLTTLSHTFYQADIFDKNIGSWDTSKVTDMENTFWKAYAFNGNIESWDTSNVTDMRGIFGHALKFDKNIGSWNTSNVTKMRNTFWNAQLFNQDLSDWDTSKVTDMTNMFRNAYEFSQDISPWCVPLIQSKPSDFDNNTPAGFRNTPERQPQWGTCPPEVLSNPVIV